MKKHNKITQWMLVPLLFIGALPFSVYGEVKVLSVQATPTCEPISAQEAVRCTLEVADLPTLEGESGDDFLFQLNFGGQALELGANVETYVAIALQKDPASETPIFFDDAQMVLTGVDGEPVANAISFASSFEPDGCAALESCGWGVFDTSSTFAGQLAYGVSVSLSTQGDPGVGFNLSLDGEPAIAFTADSGAVLAPASDGVLFEDHFDEPELSAQWQTIKSGQWIEDGWLHTLDSNSGRDSFAVVHDADISWTDYTFTVTADGILSMGGAVEDFILLFRTRDVSYATTGVDGYYYRLDVAMAGLEGFTLYRFNGLASTSTVLYRNAEPIESDLPIAVKIKVTGPRIQVWFDAKPVIDVIDSNPLLYGGIGLGAVWETEARFDDVVVSENTPSFTPVVLSLGDATNNGVQEIAVVVDDPVNNTLIAMVKDINGVVVQNIAFNGSFRPISALVLPDMTGDGAVELGVLSQRPDSGSQKLEIRDPLNGLLVRDIWFSKNNTLVSATVINDVNGDGYPDLAVLLAEASGSGALFVQIKDPLTGGFINNVSFANGYMPLGLIGLPDIDHSGAPELAVLGRSASGEFRTSVRDALSDMLISRITYGSQKAIDQLAWVPEAGAISTTALAALRVGSSVSVRLSDTNSGARINDVYFNPSFQPLKLLVVPDYNGNGASELAVLSSNASSDEVKAEIRDAASGVLLRNVWWPTGFIPLDIMLIPDINGNAASELVALERRPSDGKLRAVIKDAKTNQQLGAVDF